MKFYFFILTVLSSINCPAQIEIVPIFRDPIPVKETKDKSARVESLPPMALPFWDDFTFNNSPYYPNSTLWENSNSVWVNSGTGLNPPSLNVATFDGYDESGKPYSLNNILAKGFADQMTSAPLKLEDVPLANRKDSLMSFFYQFKGNGDAPEPGDILSLLFKNRKGQWIKVWSTEEDANFKSDEFVQKVISISDTSFFHNNFQFRFQNFGRLSGPYDTWNVDYVYVNYKKFLKSRKSYPDRTIATPLTSLFKRYWSMPLTHFKNDSLFAKPTFDTYNLRIPNSQPTDHSCVAYTVSYKAKTKIDSTHTLLDRELENTSNLEGGKHTKRSLVKLPRISSFNPSADSIKIQLKVNISAKDNLVPADNGDFDPAIFGPIKFTSNDTIIQTYTLASYYAYDDGTAEYGAKITGSGTQLAYQFDLVKADTATIRYVDVYLPRFGDESNQTFQLQILSALTGSESDYLLRKTVSIKRNSFSKFWRIEINPGVIVKGNFYVGFKLNSAAVIVVGLDGNTDSGDKIFFNGNSTWEQNKTLKGSLMIRPVFGAKEIPTAVETLEAAKPYPNPTKGTFFLPATAEQIHLFDLSGKEIMSTQIDQFDKKEITITNPTTGFYLIRYFDQTWHTEKIMVLP